MRRCAPICLALVVVVTPAWGQAPGRRKATIEHLRALQTREGGFAAAPGQARPSLRATSAALRALRYFGGEPRDRRACAAFVDRCFDRETGGFRDRPGEGRPDVTTSAVGVMAVVELKMPLEKYAGPAAAYLGKNAKTFEEIRIAAAGFEALGRRPMQAEEWIRQVLRLQNPDGTFGKGDGRARATGGAVAALLRLGWEPRRTDAIIRAMKEGQRVDGGFGREGAKGSDLETTYRVMRALVMLKARPDAGKVRTFVARCRHSDGGYGVAPGQRSSAGATYFASIVLHWLDG